MRRASFVIIGASMVMLVLACGGGAATTQAPGQVGQPTTPPVAVPPAQLCAGQPTFSLATPQPSFAQDTELNAKFPTTIDGQPVTRVQSGYYLTFLCYLGNTDQVNRFAGSIPGSNLAALSFGSGRATVGGEEITISAFRLPGGDANQIIQHFNEFAVAIGADPSSISGSTQTQATIGGKAAYVFTDQDGDVSYAYPSGDTVWSVSGTTEEQAATVFAALP
jgi:hypothetical protein